jgi:Zn-finger nucleic acid-binding protein
MKAKARESSSANELQFELKYCERCGGLWLRPAGGGQIYCVACGRAMGELPPATYVRDGGKGARMPQGPQWGADDRDVESYEEYEGLDLDAAGGVA